MAIELNTIIEAIRQQQAPWTAEETEQFSFSDDQKRSLLGVIVDQERLALLQAEPEVDVEQAITDIEAVLGLSLDDLGEGGTPLGDVDIPDVPGNPGGLGLGGPSAGLKDDKPGPDPDAKPRPRPTPRPIAPSVDWRNRRGRNNVTAIRHQGFCGSCVSFGTNATLESMLLVERNRQTDLSEADLQFCGGGSCSGWWPDPAIARLKDKGVSREDCFPYQDRNLPCQPCSGRDSQATKVRKSLHYFMADNRKRYLTYVGPMIAVFNVYEDFYAYRRGVYRHVSGQLLGSHCVEIIGYSNSDSCWIAKNSWGGGFGDGGFFRIAFGQGGMDGPDPDDPNRSSYPFWGIYETLPPSG